jgi:hypothetical protein
MATTRISSSAIAFTCAIILTIATTHQADGQLHGGQKIECDFPMLRNGNAPELNPFDYIAYTDEVAEKVGACFSYFCVNGTVEVRYQFLSYICDKPTNDKDWLLYVEQAPEREDGPRKWRWQVPARIIDLIKKQGGDVSSIPTAGTTTTTTTTTTTPSITRKSTTVTTSRPVTSTSHPTTAKPSTLLRQALDTKSTTSKPIVSNSKSKTATDGPRLYRPKYYNFSEPNPRWTKDLSALEVDYSELDGDTDSVDSEETDVDEESNTSIEEDFTTEEDMIETTTIRPATRITSSATRRTTTTSAPTTSTSRPARVQLRTSATSESINDRPLPSIKRPPSVRLPNRIPIAHNYLDDGMKIEASTFEDTPLKDPVFWNHIILVIVVTAGVLIVLYCVVTIVRLVGWATQEYLKNKWVKESPQATNPNHHSMRTIYNFDV